MVISKTKWLYLILSVTILLSSCVQVADGTNDNSTSVSTVADVSENTSQTTTAEPKFSGNNDYFSFADHILYENGDGITFELLAAPYKLGDSLENLGVRIVDVDEKLWIHNQSPYINIDKKINGEWVRLEIVIGDNAKSNGSSDEVGRNRRDEILGEYGVYHMYDCEIIPALTAGEYRFVAYFAVECSKFEIRQYHIPFEVVE